LKFFKAIAKFITKVNEIIAIIGAYLIFPIIAIIAIEVICRYFINKPTIWAYDMTWMLYGCLIFMGGAYALANNVHVRADIFYNLLPKVGQLIINLICYPAFFFFSMAAFVYSSFFLMRNAWVFSEVSRYTMWGAVTWPCKTVLFVSMTMLMLQGIIKFIQLIKEGVTRDKPKEVEGGEAA